MFDYKGDNSELIKCSKRQVYNYKNIKNTIKSCNKRNKRVLNCFDKVNRIMDNGNIYMVKECKKQVQKKLKGKLENPRVYIDEIIFNKKLKKTGGENIKKYDFRYTYAPYKYILSDYLILDNKLKNHDIKKKNNTIINNYYIDVCIHLFVIMILVFILFYIYYYNLFGI